jgi:hypothetical protein
LDFGSGTGSVGNNKGVKSVFSGHRIVLLLLCRNGRMRSNRKAQVAKGDLRELREIFY